MVNALILVGCTDLFSESSTAWTEAVTSQSSASSNPFRRLSQQKGQ
jgi:hypothetical protein